MPAVGHEAVVQLFDVRSGLVGSVLGGLGYAVPEGVPSLADSKMSARRPLELHADHVFLIEADGEERLVVVLEVQSTVPDRRKWRTWAAYQAIAAREHDCPALVLVVALGGRVARGCRGAQPFEIGPGTEMRVALVGPDEVMDRESLGLREAEWAVLAVACGTLDLDTPAGREQALGAFAHAAVEDLAGYYKFVFAMAPESALAALEELMATEYKETIVDRLLAEGKETGREIGRRQGAGESLLVLLGARGMEVPAGVRDGVLACTDTDLLHVWIERAATAGTLAEVFGEQLSEWS